MEKVAEKSGVNQRHIAGKNETAYDLSVKACDKLFQSNDKNDIDGIIYCSLTLLGMECKCLLL